VPDHGLVSTPWTSAHIWMRRHFNPGEITPEQIAHLCVSDYHDEDIEVYINGVLAYRAVIWSPMNPRKSPRKVEPPWLQTLTILSPLAD
jgi:hypothetical protein